MAFLRGTSQSRPGSTHDSAQVAGAYEQRRARSGRLASGTLACARCDAPVAIGPRPMLVSDRLSCPYCQHEGALREFLSLASPSRPARVVVRVRARPRAPVR